MIVSVHQPQYLPWLGYFHKICHSDVFVFLDNVQYKKREFQNRNRIRTKQGAMWLTVPVLNEGSYPNISDVRIDNFQEWRARHWKSICSNYSKSEFFDSYSGFFKDLYEKKWERLVDLNICIVKHVNGLLDLNKDVYLESQFNIKTTNTERIIDICKTLKADTYLSGIGGRGYLDEKLFGSNSIRLIYQDFKHPEYGQRHEPFIPFMSAIDFLFNHGADELKILMKPTGYDMILKERR